MCGIAGLYCKNEATARTAINTLSKMSLRLIHRGPDANGLKWFDKQNFGLAHRRLSIIDLSEAAAQPMQVFERYWLSFNGEIYNYLELRAELLELGASFKSTSDAEVLLLAYIHWGTACLKRFNGMWAFAIFDTQENTLFCARDPYGVKPFYFLDNDTHFGFASEIKALLEIPSYTAKANTSALLRYFGLNKVETQTEGFFKGIFELSPGHLLTYDFTSNNKHVERYYEVAYIAPSLAKAQLKATLEDAVALRLRADVPLGFCLSGGLDSSSLLHIAAQIHKHDAISSLSSGLNAFTAAHHSELDERQWAEQMIGHTKATWHVCELTSQELIEGLPQLIYHQDIPLLSTSTYAQSRVMKSAAQNQIKILIDGQGGDELFAGYQVFYPTFFKELFWSGKWKQFYIEWKQLGNAPTSKKYIIKEWIKDILSFLPPNLQQRATQKKNPTLGYLKKSPEFKRKRFKTLQAHLSFYCTHHELKNLLRWEDRCAMQYSIESRTPFADDAALLICARSLQATDLIHNGWSKYSLRKTLDGALPKTISWRRDKKGFSVPESDWLMQTAAFWKEQIQINAPLDKCQLIDKEKLVKNLPRIFSDAKFALEQNFVFRYVCYLIWLKTFDIKYFD